MHPRRPVGVAERQVAPVVRDEDQVGRPVGGRSAVHVLGPQDVREQRQPGVRVEVGEQRLAHPVQGVLAAVGLHDAVLVASRGVDVDALGALDRFERLGGRPVRAAVGALGQESGGLQDVVDGDVRAQRAEADLGERQDLGVLVGAVEERPEHLVRLPVRPAHRLVLLGDRAARLQLLPVDVREPVDGGEVQDEQVGRVALAAVEQVQGGVRAGPVGAQHLAGELLPVLSLEPDVHVVGGVDALLSEAYGQVARVAGVQGAAHRVGDAAAVEGLDRVGAEDVDDRARQVGQLRALPQQGPAR